MYQLSRRRHVHGGGVRGGGGSVRAIRRTRYRTEPALADHGRSPGRQKELIPIERHRMSKLMRPQPAMSSSYNKTSATAWQPAPLLPTTAIDVLHSTGWCNDSRYDGEAIAHDQDGALKMLTLAMSLLNVEPSKVEGIPSSCLLPGKDVNGNAHPGCRDCCNAQIKPHRLPH